ncbi:hypothetical protein V9T40_007355 [Parthenolecanium corni]|uniref:RRM domain-containing protein n=1 Tax=Parthenolecanium corni TaxID=536013 RepID=A0AAN9TV63_9HEMI
MEPQPWRSTGSRVFVGGLTYGVRERDLEKFFSKVGKVVDISMKNGYAFVEFDDYRDADDAVYELNGKDLMGERVSVEKARGTPRGSDVWRGSGRHPRDYGPPPPRRRSRGRDRDSGDHRNNERYGPPTRTDYRLIVENLSSRISWQDLKDYMRQAGEVTYADAHKQRRNEGVVEFASYSDMKTAIEKLDDTELNGRRIHLVEDRRRRRSRSSSSRSRSRSRSRDHSKSRSRNSRSGSRRRSKSPIRSRSKSHSPGHSKSRSPTPVKKRSRSRSASVTNHKRSKRSESESSDKRSRSISRERNGRSDNSADEDD